MSRTKRIVVVRRDQVEAEVRRLERDGYPEVTRMLMESGNVLLRAKQATISHVRTRRNWRHVS